MDILLDGALERMAETHADRKTVQKLFNSSLPVALCNCNGTLATHAVTAGAE